MARRTLQSKPKLPYLTDSHIEEEAALLLAEFGNKHGQVLAPPIPIDDIVDVYLRLRIEMNDLQNLFGVGDVHGALWVNQRRVEVDMSLDPEVFPAMRGRYHFTLAHEAGHWRLHRRLFQRKANQLSLLPEGAERPEYVCRSTDRNPIEIQANKFAAALLMPREMVKRAWHEQHGGMDPIYLDDLRAVHRQIQSSQLFQRFGCKPDDDKVTDEELLADASRPLADIFEVSPDAMRIRLEGMQFLLRKKEPTLF
ncbi:MAG: ImmA/IrrE family metallo-endopeptidase [Pirellulaceae bacterium]